MARTLSRNLSVLGSGDIRLKCAARSAFLNEVPRSGVPVPESVSHWEQERIMSSNLLKAISTGLPFLHYKASVSKMLLVLLSFFALVM